MVLPDDLRDPFPQAELLRHPDPFLHVGQDHRPGEPGGQDVVNVSRAGLVLRIVLGLPELPDVVVQGGDAAKNRVGADGVRAGLRQRPDHHAVVERPGRLPHQAGEERVAGAGQFHQADVARVAEGGLRHRHDREGDRAGQESVDGAEDPGPQHPPAAVEGELEGRRGESAHGRGLHADQQHPVPVRHPARARGAGGSGQEEEEQRGPSPRRGGGREDRRGDREEDRRLGVDEHPDHHREGGERNQVGVHPRRDPVPDRRDLGQQVDHRLRREEQEEGEGAEEEEIPRRQADLPDLAPGEPEPFRKEEGDRQRERDRADEGEGLPPPPRPPWEKFVPPQVEEDREDGPRPEAQAEEPPVAAPRRRPVLRRAVTVPGRAFRNAHTP